MDTIKGWGNQETKEQTPSFISSASLMLRSKAGAFIANFSSKTLSETQEISKFRENGIVTADGKLLIVLVFIYKGCRLQSSPSHLPLLPASPVFSFL